MMKSYPLLINPDKTMTSKLRLTLPLCGLLIAGAAFAADAKTSFEDHCASCHGADGKGQTKMGKKLAIRDYSDAKVQASFTDEEAFKAVREGKKDKNGKTQMKPIEELSDDEVKAVVQHMRSLKS